MTNDTSELTSHSDLWNFDFVVREYFHNGDGEYDCWESSCAGPCCATAISFLELRSWMALGDELHRFEQLLEERRVDRGQSRIGEVLHGEHFPTLLRPRRRDQSEAVTLAGL